MAARWSGLRCMTGCARALRPGTQSESVRAADVAGLCWCGSPSCLQVRWRNGPHLRAEGPARRRWSAMRLLLTPISRPAALPREGAAPTRCLVARARGRFCSPESSGLFFRDELHLTAHPLGFWLADRHRHDWASLSAPVHFFSAITARSVELGSETLLPILLFPLLVPVLVFGATATAQTLSRGWHRRASFGAKFDCSLSAYAHRLSGDLRRSVAILGKREWTTHDDAPKRRLRDANTTGAPDLGRIRTGGSCVGGPWRCGHPGPAMDGLRLGPAQKPPMGVVQLHLLRERSPPPGWRTDRVCCGGSVQWRLPLASRMTAWTPPQSARGCRRRGLAFFSIVARSGTCSGGRLCVGDLLGLGSSRLTLSRCSSGPSSSVTCIVRSSDRGG